MTDDPTSGLQPQPINSGLQPQQANPIPASVQQVMPTFPPPGMAGFGFQISTGPAPDKFLEKMQPEHIDKVLAYTDAQKAREHTQKTHFFWGTLIIGVVGFLGLCWMFLAYAETAMLEKILALFIGLVGGGAAGYGYGKKQSSKPE